MNNPAGWYTDPQDSARLRWWDGTTWTARTKSQMDATEPDDYFLRAARGNTGRSSTAPMSLVKKLALPGAMLVGLAPTCIVVGVIVSWPCAMSDLYSKDCSTTEAIGVTLFWIALACLILGAICLSVASWKWIVRRKDIPRG